MSDDDKELKALLATRRELGPEVEDHLVDTFLARVQDKVDARVREQVAEKLAQPAAPIPGFVVPASLLACLPLVALAGCMDGTEGVGFVMAGACVMLGMYLFSARRPR